MYAPARRRADGHAAAPGRHDLGGDRTTPARRGWPRSPAGWSAASRTGCPFAVFVVEVDDLERLLASQSGREVALALETAERGLTAELAPADLVVRERLGRWWLTSPDRDAAAARDLGTRVAAAIAPPSWAARRCRPRSASRSARRTARPSTPWPAGRTRACSPRAPRACRWPEGRVGAAGVGGAGRGARGCASAGSAGWLVARRGVGLRQGRVERRGARDALSVCARPLGGGRRGRVVGAELAGVSGRCGSPRPHDYRAPESTRISEIGDPCRLWLTICPVKATEVAIPGSAPNSPRPRRQERPSHTPSGRAAIRLSRP